jgi:hypothetical protein
MPPRKDYLSHGSESKSLRQKSSRQLSEVNVPANQTNRSFSDDCVKRKMSIRNQTGMKTGYYYVCLRLDYFMWPMVRKFDSFFSWKA